MSAQGKGWRSPLSLLLAFWSVSDQDGEGGYPKEECLQEPEQLSLTIRDAFRLAQYHGIQGLSHVNLPGKPVPIAQEGVMMVHQVLSEGAQGPEALVRNTLGPEDNPLKENQRHRIPIRSLEPANVYS